jgi:hypothetical protein
VGVQKSCLNETVATDEPNEQRRSPNDLAEDNEALNQAGLLPLPSPNCTKLSAAIDQRSIRLIGSQIFPPRSNVQISRTCMETRAKRGAAHDISAHRQVRH